MLDRRCMGWAVLILFLSGHVATEARYLDAVQSSARNEGTMTSVISLLQVVADPLIDANTSAGLTGGLAIPIAFMIFILLMIFVVSNDPSIIKFVRKLPIDESTSDAFAQPPQKCKSGEFVTAICKADGAGECIDAKKITADDPKVEGTCLCDPSTDVEKTICRKFGCAVGAICEIYDDRSSLCTLSKFKSGATLEMPYKFRIQGWKPVVWVCHGQPPKKSEEGNVPQANSSEMPAETPKKIPDPIVYLAPCENDGTCPKDLRAIDHIPEWPTDKEYTELIKAQVDALYARGTKATSKDHKLILKEIKEIRQKVLGLPPSEVQKGTVQDAKKGGGSHVAVDKQHGQTGGQEKSAKDE